MKKASGPFSRGQLAQFVGVSQREIQLYHDHGLLQPLRRRRGRSGDVAYHAEHVARLHFIRRGLGLGYLLEDISRLLDLDAIKTCRDVYDVTMRRIQEAQAHEPKRAAALAQLAGECPRIGSRRQCPLIDGLRQPSTASKAPAKGVRKAAKRG